MPMNRDLLLALLSMDAYNRGARAAIKATKLPANGSLGRANIINIETPAGSAEASFYAIAYELDGEKIISYRGTDDKPKDALSGFAIGVGSTIELQAQLAVEFYNAVLESAGGDPRLANIATASGSVGATLASSPPSS